MDFLCENLRNICDPEASGLREIKKFLAELRRRDRRVAQRKIK